MKKAKPGKKWFIGRLYNLLIILGMMVACYLCGKIAVSKISTMDIYLSSKSPYATLADFINIHGESGLRLKIPKPVLLQVARDLVPYFALIGHLFEDIYLDCKESVVGEDVERKEKRLKKQQIVQPLIAKPSGASLLYVSSFCKEIFGDLTPLETCRSELMLHCKVDVLGWFDISPAESRESSECVQNCLTNKFQQRADFITQFNRKIETQEKHAKVSPPPPKKGQKFFVFGALITVFILMLCGSVKVYMRIKKNLQDKELEDKMLAIDGRVLMLQANNLKDEPDIFIGCQDISVEVKNDDEVECFGVLMLIMEELRPIVDFYEEMEDMQETVFETNSDLTDMDDDEFVNANLIEDISSDLYSWALIIDQLEIKIDDFQLWDETSSDDGNISATVSLHLESLCIALEELEVHLGDNDKLEFETEEPPPMLTLDMSWQENLLENARVGITTIHKCDFDFDIEDDGTGANEDNIIVTGLTVDKDDPLKFVFWKKRLRDVREILKADALARLKSQCPTLFAMGWFKENLPKEEKEIEREDEELKKEALIKEEEMKSDHISNKVKTREKQISDNIFVTL